MTTPSLAAPSASAPFVSGPQLSPAIYPVGPGAWPASLPLSPAGRALAFSFRFTPAEAAALRPRERTADGQPLTVPAWAARHRRVVKGAHCGPWQNDLVPWAIEPMRCWTAPHIRKIFLCWSGQTSKTNVGINCLCFSIDQNPGSAMYVMPDEKVTKRISRRRLLPTFRTMPRIAALLSPRESDTSTLAVHFTNGADLMMTWATSAAELASEDARDMIFDEIDKYPTYAGREASPLKLGEVRSKTYPHTKKLLYSSSPADAPSEIWEALKTECNIVYAYEACCPYCGTHQQMDFEHFSWPESVADPLTIVLKKLAHYSCASCGLKWDDYARDLAVSAGRWVPGRITERDEWEPLPDPPARPIAVGFWLPGWYSRDVSLSDSVAQYLRGKDDLEEEMVFITDHAARPFSKTIETKSEVEVLTHKTPLSAGIVPRRALVLTAGIDVQKFGFWFVIRAWMEDLTSHKIQHGFVPTFADVEKIIFDTRWRVDGSPLTLSIWRAAIDTGGGPTDSAVWTRTEEVYEWLCAHKTKGTVFGTKGASRAQLQRVKVSRVETMPHSRLPIPGGLELRLVDTDQFKALLHWRLTRTGTETQRFYLDADTDTDYARQFLAEQLIRRKNGRREWITRGENHLLDCEVLAAAAADRHWVPSLTMLAPAIADQLRQAEARLLTQAQPGPRPAAEGLTDAPDPHRSYRDYERPNWVHR
jgi:phage terminase large subunit GpA-like protein